MKVSKNMFVQTGVSAFALAMAAFPQIAWSQQIAPPASAQPDATAGTPTSDFAKPNESGAGDIIVTARRREERLQDVPQTVNAVTGAAIEKLNIKQFEEIQNVVPGLRLQSVGDGFTFRASLRGVGYDSVSSVPPNVQFYTNEALVSPFSLFQSLYDVGQIEVLRGPQGTLRGRSAPSGQITVTTRKPGLTEVGGFALISGTSKSGINGSAALSVPLITDVLAIRVAGLVDENDTNFVKSATGGTSPYSRTQSGRVSLRFEPANWFDANVMYQYLAHQAATYAQVESASIAQPGIALGYGSNALIQARDRLAAGNDPTTVNEKQHLIIGNANARFAGQQLSYVGSHFEVKSDSRQPFDFTNLFPGQNIYQLVPIKSSQDTHELRLSSDDRLFGFLDYTVGGLYVKTLVENPVTSPTVLAFGAGVPAGVPGFPLYIGTVNTQIAGVGRQTEKSFFGNLTAHIGDQTEVSGGLRRINYRNKNFLAVVSPAISLQDIDAKYHATIYNFSIKHRFSDALVVYANTGSSYRLGVNAVGIFRPLTEGLDQFVNTKPEKSKSYEIGAKTVLFDRKLNLNVDAFYQKFDGFLYRNSSA